MSASGFCVEGAPERGVGRVHSNSAQRSSISHPMVACGNASRSMTAAGRLWTTSPMELRRTIRMRWKSALGGAIEAVIGSPFPRREPGADDFAGGVILGIADDRHPAAMFADYVRFGNAFGGVVRSFGLYIGTDLADQCAHVWFGENDYCVDVRQGGKNLGAFFGRHQRTTFALQRADGFVGVDRHHQAAAQFFGGMQVSHVADMQQIEAAVSQGDALSGTAPLVHALAQSGAVENLGFCRCV